MYIVRNFRIVDGINEVGRCERLAFSLFHISAPSHDFVLKQNCVMVYVMDGYSVLTFL